MACTIANSPTRFFCVVGAAYVAERHADWSGHLAVPRTRSGRNRRERAVGGVLCGDRRFAVDHAQAAEALPVAATALRQARALFG